ncbi:imidazole glycerol phosphate synthase subunit HisF [Methylomonas methanica]|uniref:imidazole glycerol-phosphate synthase n=1 Tax=Methylomonas methanica (strain DSM 25384 / MC09) TaxID=857087 RepID=F9ZWC9_METMM|nr:imidazole glycerol phosphate synthase cyclase subunit [Methylomonas methanica]AEF99598.1 histidine biosynthesis protein [Methylomonas methanica MC09]
MQKPRIIARLDIKTANVVKGIRFEGLRIMGKPDELATRYYEQGADELLYIDTVASLYGRNNLSDVVKQAASHIFIPMTVGGGIRTVGDAQTLLRSGADKIAINTAAVKNPKLIKELASILGSQAIVVSLQVKCVGPEKWEIYVDNGREKTGLDAMDWAKQVEELGAGELLVTSVDRDGTGLGFDEQFISRLASNVSLPVVAGGGAKGPQDISHILSETDASAVAIASMLHYGRATIGEIKQELTKVGISTARH